MAKKKETENSLPLDMHSESTEKTSAITYANDVVAIIAGLAASEVEGIAGMVNVNGSLLGKNKNITRGVKVEVGTEEVSVDLYLNVEYGTPIQRAAHDAQEGVKKSIESMTGLHVVRVDVHVMGVSFEKEMTALQAGAGKAALESGKPVKAPEKKAETKPAETKPAEKKAPAEKNAEPKPSEEKKTSADKKAEPKDKAEAGAGESGAEADQAGEKSGEKKKEENPS